MRSAILTLYIIVGIVSPGFSQKPVGNKQGTMKVRKTKQVMDDINLFKIDTSIITKENSVTLQDKLAQKQIQNRRRKNIKNQ